LSACKVQAFLFLVVPVVCLPASLQGLAEKNTGAKRGWFFSRQPARQGRLAGVARQTAIFAARNEDAVKFKRCIL